MAHTVIIGGGPCGLAAATRLAEAGERVTVLEAQHFLGGHGTTLRDEEGAGYDFGPHAYHAQNERVLALFKEMAHDGFPAQGKNVRIKFRGKYYRYPLEAVDLARSMDPVLAARAFIDYLLERARQQIRPRRMVSAEDWVVQSMGRTLYDLFFGPYTTKVWGVPPSRLAASFAQHRIPHLSLWQVIVKAFRKGRRKLTGKEHRYAPLVIELYYPPKGAGILWERMAERIRRAGGEVRCGVLVSGFEIAADRVTAVRVRRVSPTRRDGELCLLNSGGEKEPSWPADVDGEEVIPCDAVINSAPLPTLVSFFGDAISREARDAARFLRFRALTVVGLRVARAKALPAQSIYFQDKSFNRLSETRNYGGSEICAPGKTVLLCDITCDVGDRIWTMPPDELGAMCARELEEEGFMRASELERSVVLRSTFGYPVYMVGYEAAIDTIVAELMRFENVLTGGRQGLYKYVDMDIASEMGLSMADHLLEGRTKAALAGVPYEDRNCA